MKPTFAAWPAALVGLASAGYPGGASAESKIKQDEEVLFFCTAAQPEADGWRVPIHGWIFEPERDSIWRAALVKSVIEALDLDRASIDTELVRGRLYWFAVDNERGKVVRVRVGGRELALAKSGKDGHFRGELQLPARAGDAAKDGWLTFTTHSRSAGNRQFSGKVLLVPATGTTVISNIDDTIKISEVHETRLLLRNTFVEPYRAVAGMAELYQEW